MFVGIAAGNQMGTIIALGPDQDDDGSLPARQAFQPLLALSLAAVFHGHHRRIKDTLERG